MKRAIIFSLLLALAVPFVPAQAATIAPGDLIKASGPAVYYYADNGTRMVFPNEKTYLSWYSDFSNVKTISDAELAELSIGGNITYRPGSSMVKITTDPKVYAVDEGGTLRWIATEALASELYGTSWAKNVRDIPDAFFVDYEIGDAITASTQYRPADILAANTKISTPAVTIERTETSISTKVGETITISLESNASTGYAWKAEYDNAKLELTERSYIQPDTMLVGASGTDKLTFKGLEEGATDIIFSYRREWEGDDSTVKIATYHVTIGASTVVSTPSNVALTITKNEAQKGEELSLSATYTGDKAVTSFTLTANDTTVKDCGAGATCSSSFTIPTVDTTEVYTFKAIVVTADGTISDSKTTAVVSEQTLASIRVDIARLIMRQTQKANITVYPGSEINANEIRIYIDGSSKKLCPDVPSKCALETYIDGSIGSTHTVYATIKTPGDLMYKSETKTVTLAENDAPMITAEAGKISMSTTETADVTATAQDDDGIESIQISKDGTVLKTCSGAAPCTATAGPFNLSSGSVVSFDVTAIDLLGQSATKENAVSVTIL